MVQVKQPDFVHESGFMGHQDVQKRLRRLTRCDDHGEVTDHRRKP